MRASRSATGEDGFTILELIVCLGLLALISSFVLEGVALLKRGAAVIGRAELQDSERAVQMHLRRALERAVPFFAVDENLEATLIFTGEPARLRVVTRSDGRLEEGGLILAEFRAETIGAARALITERRPIAWAPGGADAAPEQHT
ncbi:MAG: prepilin-type N-terminal cleavage/methylation domain-containing protein, partial [Rhizobiales bacterium]|nr:prepilin-type N-terminal cleavage/methylation domain-containing protein [Hyphomicrobiales bacterium]